MDIPEKFKDKYKSITLLKQQDLCLKRRLYESAQTGSGQTIKEKYKFIDTGGLYIYNINKNIIDKYVEISIVSKEETQCVIIIIDTKTGIAGLTTMSDTGKCVNEGLNKSVGNSGTKILKVAMNIILDNKRKYNIKYVNLIDKSYISCDNCKNPVKLAQLRTVIKGESWFSSYGFKPLVNSRKPTDCELDDISELMKNNREIFTILKTKDVDIAKLVAIGIKKQKIYQIDIKEVADLIKEYPLMRNFIIALTKDFNKNCCLISYLLDSLFDSRSKTGLVDFYDKEFYLEI